MNICYWNIGKKGKPEDKAFYDAVSTMLDCYSPDLICFSEFEFLNDKFILEKGYFLVDEAFCDKVKCFKKDQLAFIQIRIGDRYCFVKNKENNCLFVFLHSYDARNHDESKRLIYMQEIKGEIDEYLEDKNETNVFIVGDFNCMPYEASIVNKDVLNCTLFRRLLNTKEGAKERYYNPMLLLLSEEKDIYGSYFNDSLPNNLKWYLLDQIIVNKNADNIIDYNSIKLMTTIGTIDIMKNGKPNVDLYSDHLPLYFEIKEKPYE